MSVITPVRGNFDRLNLTPSEENDLNIAVLSISKARKATKESEFIDHLEDAMRVIRKLHRDRSL